MAKRNLDGTVGLVTGASSGIGRCLALALAKEGVKLVLVARRESLLNDLVGQIQGRGGTAVGATGDVTDPDVRREALRAATEQFGGLDLLVNNAGISAHGRFATADPARLRQIMEVNFFAAVELTRLAIPLLQAGRRPIVVNVGSILGRRGIPFNSEYCASKFALTGFSEAVRPELARLGIDLLLVTPGTTDTDLFAHLIEKSDEIPWRQSRGVPPQRVAASVVCAIRLGRRETIPSRSGKMLLWLNRFAPSFVDRWMRRYG